MSFSNINSHLTKQLRRQYNNSGKFGKSLSKLSRFRSTNSTVTLVSKVFTQNVFTTLLLSPKADTHFTIPQRVEG